MEENNLKRDTLPGPEAKIDEIIEFWDTHSSEAQTPTSNQKYSYPAIDNL